LLFPDRRPHFLFSRICRYGCLLVLLTAFAPLCAFAALGGDLNSVLADQVHFQGNLKVTQMGSFEIHEIRPQSQAATGTTNGVPAGTSRAAVIREYVSPAGKVFAITWQGEWPPDMHQLLGSYFQRYVDAVKAQASARPGRGAVRIMQPDFVAQMSGHMRFSTGKVYLPDQLPAGVQPEAIQ
jgi:hypothetical protein